MPQVFPKSMNILARLTALSTPLIVAGGIIAGTAFYRSDYTTGTREVVELLRSMEAEVIGAGSIIDRSGGKAEVSVRRVALVPMEVTAWTEADCPLCKQGIPVVKPGSRK